MSGDDRAKDEAGTAGDDGAAGGKAAATQAAAENPAPKAKAAKAPTKPAAPETGTEAAPAPRALRRLGIVAWVALLGFLFDRAVKFWVVEMLDLRHVLRIDIAPPYLTLLMAWNEGANFGLGNDLGRGFWIALALAISAGLTAWALRLASPWRRLCIGLLVGGALGNALDRWLYGAVADFLNMSCCGFSNPYAFNPADVFIFAGAFGFVLLGAEAPAAEAQSPEGGK